MGNNTWNSLPKKPLPDRFNCILSSQYKRSKHNIEFFKNKNDFLRFTNNINYDNIWIIGGESIYKQFINEPYVKNIYLTHILHDFKCDTFFPKFNEYYTLNNSQVIDENTTLNIYKKIYNTINNKHSDKLSQHKHAGYWG